MPRIAKSDVYAALERAASIIRSADVGNDGRISRAEMKAKLESMPAGTEKSLADMFFRFSDHRDHKKYAKLTGADLEKTLAYSFKELVADYDLNNNGLSNAEISKMSRTAQLAVQLAKELKAAQPEPTPSPTQQQTSGAEQVQWL